MPAVEGTRPGLLGEAYRRRQKRSDHTRGPITRLRSASRGAGTAIILGDCHDVLLATSDDTHWQLLRLSGPASGSGFGELAQYIFGGNREQVRAEGMPLTLLTLYELGNNASCRYSDQERMRGPIQALTGLRPDHLITCAPFPTHLTLFTPPWGIHPVAIHPSGENPSHRDSPLPPPSSSRSRWR